MGDICNDGTTSTLINNPNFEFQVLVWLTKLREQVGDGVSDADMRDFIWNTLASGQVG